MRGVNPIWTHGLLRISSSLAAFSFSFPFATCTHTRARTQSVNPSFARNRMKRGAQSSEEGESPSKRRARSPASPQLRLTRVGPAQGLLHLPRVIIEDILGRWLADGVSLQQWAVLSRVSVAWRIASRDPDGVICPTRVERDRCSSAVLAQLSLLPRPRAVVHLKLGS